MSYIEIDDDTGEFRVYCSTCGGTETVGRLDLKKGLLVCPLCGIPL